MIVIGLDDTDVIGSPGTGHLARMIADDLAADFTVGGVIRHQLLFDPRIPYTAKNSSASILIESDSSALDDLFDRVRQALLANFVDGSDPGLAIAADIPADVIAFGKQAKMDIVMQESAQSLADEFGIHLVGLGGTNDGIIGAMASLGLAASGDDGRYIRVGTVRNLSGLQPVGILHTAGIASIQTLDGEIIESGMVHTDKLRPARRKHHPVLFVEAAPEGHWLPLKLD